MRTHSLQDGWTGRSPYKCQAFAFDLFDLRALDIAISDDKLCCLEVLRWWRADLYTLVPDGDVRVAVVNYLVRSPVTDEVVDGGV